MSDIIERLRKTASRGVSVWGDLQMEAADELERLTTALHKANSQHEHFEREWYLRGDELERLRVEIAKPAPADLIPPGALFVCPQMGSNITRVRAESAAPAVPDGWVMVPREPNEAMVKAYLLGNAKYWEDSDKQPTPPDRWRGGTPAQATAAGFRSMIAAAPAVPAAQIGMKASTWAALSPDAQNLILEAGQRAVDKTKAQRLADAAARATMVPIPLDGSAAPAVREPLRAWEFVAMWATASEKHADTYDVAVEFGRAVEARCGITGDSK